MINFKSFREYLGISQRQAADQLQIQQAMIVRYENSTNSPSTDFLKKYCETLDANPNFLLFGQEPHLLSSVPSLDIDTCYILNDLLSLFSADALKKKLQEVLIEEIINRVGTTVKDGALLKILDALMLGDHIRQRPFLFLYYIFQMITVEKSKQSMEIKDYKLFIINVIRQFNVLNLIKNKPLFTKKTKIEFIDLFELKLTENECKLIVDNSESVMMLLERKMTPLEIKAHRGVFHA